MAVERVDSEQSDVLWGLLTGLSADNWISVAMLFLTLGIVGAAWYQIRQAREAYRLSHTPWASVTITSCRETSSSRIEIRNAGLGPAFIQKVTVSIRGVTLPGPLQSALATLVNELRLHLGVPLFPVSEAAWARGTIVQAGESIHLVTFREFDSHGKPFEGRVGRYSALSGLPQAMDQLAAEICVEYSDMFGVLRTSVEQGSGERL